MQLHTVSNASKGADFISREGWGLSWSFKVCEEDVNEKVTSEWQESLGSVTGFRSSPKIYKSG